MRLVRKEKTKADMLLALIEGRARSRVDLAHVTPVSAASVSRLVDELEDMGLLRDGERLPGKGIGRKARSLTVRPDLACALGVDLDGSRMRAVVLDCANRTRGAVAEDLPAGLDGEQLVARLLRLARQALRSARAPRKRLLGVGLSLPGPLDPQTGRSRADLGIRDWAKVAPVERFATALRVPVVADLNARCALVTELSREAEEKGTALLALARHGVGLGASVGGELAGGAGGRAGEIGHTVIDPAGPACRCGHRGCMEAVAGGWALLARARERGIRTDAISALAERARAGDADVRDLFTEGARALGLALGNAANLYSPDRIYIRGIYAGLGGKVEAALREGFERAAVAEIAAAAKLDANETDEFTAAVGAAMRARRKHFVSFVWKNVLAPQWRPRGSRTA